MGSEKLDKLIDSTESLVSNLLHHVHTCDHSCCVKDVLRRIYQNNENNCLGVPTQDRQNQATKIENGDYGNG